MDEIEENETKVYSIPAWDCPICGDVHVEAGMEDIVGENFVCETCGASGKIISQ